MDPDAPALNTDGTLKDASEIQWFNSPSDEHRTINLKDSDAQKKCKHADSLAHGSDTDSEDGLPRSVLTGLKGKSPARQLMAKECGFYEKRFTVSLGKDNDSMTATSSSMTVKAKPTQPKPKKTQPKPPPTTRHTDDDMTEDNTEVDEGDESGNEQDMDEDPLQKYLRMRDVIQAERMPARKHFHQGEDPRTQDICEMFTPGELKDKASDKSKKGHICKGCVAMGHSEKNSFFSGDNSMLRTHVCWNWGTHGKMYLKIYQKMGIKPNEHALPNPEDMPSDTTMQTHLDGFIQATPNVKWSKEGLLEHILDFIISGDQSFRVVEEKPFRKLLKYQHPATQESDIPHRTKIWEEVIEKANLAIR
ncbi:hypothetical protein CPB84DRAFT_1751722 [Gymnopilus junonius]|uniref:Uncharacterized protein n=1 Tax=Gymnopilus junonius TaxID=109634 RepID=A0A9P5TI69_GYMJU|nr:hypothetical protein CPB84DRAFT_1751722 [Gymnopilus junonius]